MEEEGRAAEWRRCDWPNQVKNRLPTVVSEGRMRIRSVIFFPLFSFSFCPSAVLGSESVGSGWGEKQPSECIDGVIHHCLSHSSYCVLPSTKLRSPCRKVHGHLDRRTWNYESLRLRAPHRPSSPLLLPPDRRTCPQTTVAHPDGLRFVFSPNHRRFSFSPSVVASLLIDRRNPSFTLSLIRHFRRPPPAIHPLPHIPQLSSHNSCYEH